MKTTNLAAALGVASMLCAGAVTADPTHPRGGANQSNAAAPTATGTNNGATCKVSFATDTSTFTPPDDMINATADPNSYAALGVSAVKPCMGNVIAFFNAETNTTTSGGFIHAIGLATCVATGGLSNPCTVGQKVYAEPGAGSHHFLQTNQQSQETHAAIFVFPQMNRGQWRFQILVGGNGASNVQWRSLVVEMFGS